MQPVFKLGPTYLYLSLYNMKNAASDHWLSFAQWHQPCTFVYYNYFSFGWRFNYCIQCLAALNVSIFLFLSSHHYSTTTNFAESNRNFKTLSLKDNF